MTEPRQPKREMRYRRRGADEGPVAPPETPYVREEKPDVNPIFTNGRTSRRTAFWLQVIVALVVIGVVAAVVFAIIQPGVPVPGTQAPAPQALPTNVVWVQPPSMVDWQPFAWAVDLPASYALAA